MVKNNKVVLIKIVGTLMLALAFMTGSYEAFAAIYPPISGTTTLRVGSRGTAVRELQAIMSANPAYYPSQEVDGSFGPKTRAGVVAFQAAYGLVADGIVGPITRSMLNNLAVGGTLGGDVDAPIMSGLIISPSRNSTAISFGTNEVAKLAVFYDVSPINWNNYNDAVPSLSVPNISGQQVLDNNFTMSKSVTLPSLNANSTYHYVIAVTDQTGNTTLTWPATFVTTN
jgi:peptidoglycan hydrolase-like protein with peptidoglycan-binding domain